MFQKKFVLIATILFIQYSLCLKILFLKNYNTFEIMEMENAWVILVFMFENFQNSTQILPNELNVCNLLDIAFTTLQGS